MHWNAKHICLSTGPKIISFFSHKKFGTDLACFGVGLHNNKREILFPPPHYIIISFQHPAHDLDSTCAKCFCRDNKACLLSQKLVELKAGSENSNSLIRRASKGQCHITSTLRSQQENSFWKEEVPFEMCALSINWRDFLFIYLFLIYVYNSPDVYVACSWVFVCCVSNSLMWRTPSERQTQTGSRRSQTGPWRWRKTLWVATS